MKINNRILITSLSIITLLMTFTTKSLSQIRFFNNAYQSLYTELMPDSIIIYEVHDTWGPGILHFISFKNDKIRMGYFLSKFLIRRTVAGYTWSPKEIPEENLIIYNDNSDAIKNLKNVGIEKILLLPQSINCNERISRTDAETFSFTMISSNCSWSRDFYDVFGYTGECLHNQQVKTLKKYIQFFEEHFPETGKIYQNLIEKYRLQGTKKP